MKRGSESAHIKMIHHSEAYSRLLSLTLACSCLVLLILGHAYNPAQTLYPFSINVKRLRFTLIEKSESETVTDIHSVSARSVIMASYVG